MSLISRLKHYLDLNCISVTQFADECDIPRPSASQLLAGRNKKVSDEIICKIHRSYPSLSVSWLLFGEGDMLQVKTTSTPSEDTGQCLEEKAQEEDNSLGKQIGIKTTPGVMQFHDAVAGQQQSKPDDIETPHPSGMYHYTLFSAAGSSMQMDDERGNRRDANANSRRGQQEDAGNTINPNNGIVNSNANANANTERRVNNNGFDLTEDNKEAYRGAIGDGKVHPSTFSFEEIGNNQVEARQNISASRHHDFKQDNSPTPGFINENQRTPLQGKSVVRIMVYYSDCTYESFVPGSEDPGSNW